MKFFKIIALLLFTTIAVAQNNWQQMMSDRTSNFNDIVLDFNKYYNERVQDFRNIPKGLGIKQFKRWEYYWSQRVDVNGNFPADGYILNEYQKYLNQNAANRYASGSGNWEIVGPVYGPANGTGQMNGNGRLTCIAFHPTDPNILYAGAPAGGVWKSTDKGVSWTEYSVGLTRLGVSSIVVHPTNPDIIYIGTGDRDGGDSPGYGVWRSTDGGLTWLSYNVGMGNRTINEIIMNPGNPNILLAAASNNTVYRTIDGGANWTATTGMTVNPKDIAFHPTNSNIAYASGTKFLKSTNGGVNWVEITSGVPAGAQRIALAVSANQPDWVYLLAGGGTGLVGIYKSVDSGVNFATQATTPNILGYPTNGSDTASQAWYDLVIAADPTNANIVYTGGVNLWKSVNGGVTLNCVSYWVSPSGGIDGVHADQHVLEFSPHTNELYNGNDGGLYYSTNAGVKWIDISSGLAIAQLYKIGVSQQNSDVVINGYQDNGTGVGRGTGFVTTIGGDGMECIIDPSSDSFMYGSLYNGDIRRSTNSGSSFSGNIASSITETGAWVTPYKLDPNNNNTMLAGYANVWRNTDVRATNVWTKISSFTGTSTLIDLAIAPSNSNVVYVSRSGTDRFFRSSDALAATPTWTNLTASLPVASSPKDIEIDPSNPDILYVAIGNKIYKSSNGGASWTDFSGTLPAIPLSTIVIDKSSPVGAMYVGMDVGVYYRDNSLSNWISYSTGLSKVEITELEIHYSPVECNSKLYAATYGQGLWVSDLKDPGNNVPVACFQMENTVGCVDAVFPLTDNSDFTPTSWLWSITPATFSFANNTTATSQNPQVLFAASGNYTIQLTATNSFGSDTVSKIFNVQISGGTIASSFNQNFETQTACATTSNCGAGVCAISGLWTNLTNGTQDNIDWRIDVGGTPTANTGPAVDYNPGTATGKYAYLEATSCRAQTAILESQCLFLDQDYTFEFAYHMYGDSMGSLHVDLFSNGVWYKDYSTPFYGDKGNQWNKAKIDLNAFVGQTIKIRIRGITGYLERSDMAIDDILLVSKCSEATTWNGVSWSNGVPDTNKIAVINGNYNTAASGNIECCKIVVNSGFVLTVNDGNYVLVENEVKVDGILNVKNNGSLIQENNVAVNSGTISYERIASIRLQDYVYWSSPVAGFGTSSISPLTPSQYIFKWDPTYANPNGGSGYWLGASGQVMSSGRGYIVRGPSNFTNTAAQNFTALFNGAPNNGLISVPISRGNHTANFTGNNGGSITKFDDNLNLIGNPYPSAIDALSFLNLNSGSIEGTVRIWTHNTLPSNGTSNPFYGSYASNYTANDFIVYNGTGTLSGPAGFNGFIAGGQGFFVTMHDGPAATTNIVFKNELRGKNNNNNQFYRTESGVQKNRIWLDLVNSSQNADRTLIGYVEGATSQKDWLFDTYTKVETNSQRIYTLFGEDPLAIQAFGLPFSDVQVVPLGVQIPTAGTYNISLFAVDGLFANQDIFVKDKLNATVHNIKQSPYVFQAQQGIFNNRFELVYKSELLNNQDFSAANSITVFGNEAGIHLDATEIMAEITVYDVLGRTLYVEKNGGKNEVLISSIPSSGQVLFVKVKLENGTLLVRKLIY